MSKRIVSGSEFAKDSAESYIEPRPNATAKLMFHLAGDRYAVSMTITGVSVEVREVAMSVVALFGDRVSEAVMTTREELV